MLRVAFWGDICLQHKDLIEKSWQEPGAIDKSVRDFVEEIDFSIANLECPLYEDSSTRKDGLALHSSPTTIQFLRALKIGAVDLANNHIADYGAKCGLATIDLLEREGITWFGAGYVGEEGNPGILQCGDISLACLGYSHPPCDAVFSSHETFGSARYDSTSVESLIADLKRKVDYVLVFMHWGMEDVNYPVPENVRLARRIVDMGADAIIGSHPHVYQGYEAYDGRYILFSLGNCIFGDIVDVPVRNGRTFTRIQSLRNRIGLVPVFSIGKNGIKLVELKFVHLRKDNTLAMLTGLKARLDSFYFQRISSRLGSSDLDDYERWWRRNIKWFTFFVLLERAFTKRTVLRPGMSQLKGLKRMLRQNINDLQTGDWKG